MIGVGAEGLIVGPLAGRVTVRSRGVRGTALGVVAVEEAETGLRFVVERETEDGLRRHIEVGLGETRGAAVEVVDRTRHADAEAQRILRVLPRQFVAVMTDEAVGAAEQAVPKEVATEIRVAVIGALHADDVTFALPGVTEHQSVTFVGDLAAPVLVPPVAAGRPMVVVGVRILIPCIVDLELAAAEIPELPVQRLADGDAVLRAEVEARRAGEAELAGPEAAVEIVDELGEEVGAPAARVAGRHAPAVVRLKGLIPVRHPHHRHAEGVERHVRRLNVVVILVGDVTGGLPMQTVGLVRTGRERGRTRKAILVAPAFDQFAQQADGSWAGALLPRADGGRDGLDVPGRDDCSGDVVGGHAVSRDLERGRGRAGEDDCGRKGRQDEEGFLHD